MDRYWLFTWRTYGTWLPGETGFVGFYRNTTGTRVIGNIPTEPTAEPMPALERYCRDVQRVPAVYLTADQAAAVCAQLLETARYRTRPIDAVAVMADHVHLVFGVAGDPEPEPVLADWKAYASRAINRLAADRLANPERERRGGTPGQTPANPERERRGVRASRPVWWVEGGSTRPLKTPDARLAAVRYVRDQENPLVVWLSEAMRAELG